MKYSSCLVALCVLFWNATPLFSAPSGLETAQEFLAEERIADAYQAIQDHLQRHPEDPRGFFLNGVILERLGRFSEAMNVYRELIERHPELPEPYNNLAGLLAAAGRFDEAKDTLQRALETHPSYATAHQNLSRIYSAMAGSAYRRVLGKDDQRILVHLDPLEELSGVPEAPFPPTSVHVASVAPRGPEPGREAPTFVPPPAAPELSPEPVAAVPETTPDVSQQPSPGSAAEPVVQETPEPSIEPVPEPVSEPVAPRPAAPEPVSVPVPEPAPAPTAPTPPSVPPPAPSAPEAPAPGSGTEVVKAAITDVVLNWAKAWASQNVEAYLSFYSGNFRPESGLGLAQWREQRRTRVAAPPFIKVILSGIVVTTQGENMALVRFDQQYRSNVINDQVPKELQLRREDGQWRIVRERLLPRS